MLIFFFELCIPCAWDMHKNQAAEFSPKSLSESDCSTQRICKTCPFMFREFSASPPMAFEIMQGLGEVVLHLQLALYSVMQLLHIFWVRTKVHIQTEVVAQMNLPWSFAGTLYIQNNVMCMQNLNPMTWF